MPGLFLPPAWKVSIQEVAKIILYRVLLLNHYTFRFSNSFHLTQAFFIRLLLQT